MIHVKTASELLGLTVEHPAHDVCVVTVDGELDTLTTPLLEAVYATHCAPPGATGRGFTPGTFFEF